MDTLDQSDLLDFVECLPVAAFRTTPEGHLLMANRALVDMLAFDSAEELLSVSLPQLYADPDLRGGLVARMGKGEDFPPHDVELRRKDGSTLWVRVTARTVEDEFGDVLYMEGLLEDASDRYRAKAALEASEQRFVSAFRNAPQGLAIMGPDLVLRQVNAALCDMLGSSESDLLIGSAVRFIHPDETPDAMGLMAEMRSGVIDSYKVERRLRHADGHFIHALIATSAERDSDGRLDGIVSQVFDITERVKAQQELAASEAFFRGTFTDAPTGMVIADEGLRIRRANAAICGLLGTTESVLQGLTLSDLWDQSDDDLANLTGGGTTDSIRFLGERRLSLIQDRRIWTLVSVSGVGDPRGVAGSLLAQFVDVTERREARIALRQSESEKSALFDAITDTMLRVNRDGTFQTFRPRHVERGSGLHDTTACTVADLFPDDQERLMKRVCEVLDGGRPDHLDIGASEAGVDRFLSATISRIDGDHALITVRDVTEQTTAQTQLESLLESKDELVASVSHELRTPLTAIVGLATELGLNYEAFESEEQQEFIRLIADQSREMADLVDDLLVAAHVDRGQLVVEPRAIDLAVEVKHVLDAWSGEATKVDLAPTPPAHADDLRVRQILRNLLSNAARYGSPPVHVSVSEAGADQIEVLVKDHGPGLPYDEWEAIFEPYYRVPDREPLPGSVGLGLTVSRHLADVMHGSLDYLVKDGHSSFRLLLPVAPAD